MVDQSVVDRIFIPGLDRGLWLAGQQSIQPTRCEAAKVDALSLCSNTLQRLTAHDILATKQKWDKSVVFPTILVVAESVSVSKSTLRIGKKVVLNSTSGARFRNKIRQRYKATEAAITAKLDAAAAQNIFDVPVYSGDYKDLDLVIETKNFFNFYHFVKESFPLLTLYRKHQLRGKIIFAGGGEVSGFIRRLISTWFPDLSDVIEVDASSGTRKFDFALFGLNTSHLYFQTRNASMQDIDDVGVAVPRSASMANFVSLTNNSIEQPLLDFRDQTAAKVASGEKPTRRLYVTRKAERVRNVVGEELLLARLVRQGFEVVSFEDYDQFGQAQLMSQTEAMVTLHGAGLTNMIFMPRGSHVIELSNLQTLEKRFGDFTPLATAAGIHYCHAFLDHDFDPSDEVPVIRKHGLRGVRIDDFQADVLSSWIAEMLDQSNGKGFDSIDMNLAELSTNQLSQFIANNRYIYSNIPEFHLLDFDNSNVTGDDKSAMTALQRALLLDPKNIHIQKKMLSFAAKLKDVTAFKHASIHARKYGGSEIRAFYSKKGWTFQGFSAAPAAKSPASSARKTSVPA
ncbi:glycosyltransferase family 61 protein [Paracoccus cavernae]|uniref:Glycosyltransferase family 61 protein n=1 Tax=Paracoccus cavernae TaxID=1571207 RepID=A0ABT8D9Q5_9RHOB|nr:glycosyltransferase family 61 protein [Paracoccus cavernae]